MGKDDEETLEKSEDNIHLQCENPAIQMCLISGFLLLFLRLPLSLVRAQKSFLCLQLLLLVGTFEQPEGPFPDNGLEVVPLVSGVNDFRGSSPSDLVQGDGFVQPSYSAQYLD